MSDLGRNAEESARRFLEEIHRAGALAASDEPQIAHVADMPWNQRISQPEPTALREILAAHRRRTFRLIVGGAQPTAPR